MVVSAFPLWADTCSFIHSFLIGNNLTKMQMKQPDQDGLKRKGLGPLWYGLFVVWKHQKMNWTASVSTLRLFKEELRKARITYLIKLTSGGWQARRGRRRGEVGKATNEVWTSTWMDGDTFIHAKSKGLKALLFTKKWHNLYTTYSGLKQSSRSSFLYLSVCKGL